MQTSGKGHVVKVDPHAGAEVERGSTVVLTVSSGLHDRAALTGRLIRPSPPPGPSGRSPTARHTRPDNMGKMSDSDLAIGSSPHHPDKVYYEVALQLNKPPPSPPLRILIGRGRLSGNPSCDPRRSFAQWNEITRILNEQDPMMLNMFRRRASQETIVPKIAMKAAVLNQIAHKTIAPGAIKSPSKLKEEELDHNPNATNRVCSSSSSSFNFKGNCFRAKCAI